MSSVNFKSNLREKLDKNRFLFYDKDKIKIVKRWQKLLSCQKRKTIL